MRMALTTYEGGKPARTYEADETSLTVGVCEDVLRLVHAERWVDAGEDEQAQADITRAVMSAFMSFHPIAKEIFGIPEEEYRKCLASEVGEVIIGIVTYSMEALMGVSQEAPKNGRASKRRRRFSRRCSGSRSQSATASRASTPLPSASIAWRSSASSHRGSWSISAGRGGGRGGRTGSLQGTRGSERPF
jgi:hypothetical protein